MKLIIGLVALALVLRFGEYSYKFCLMHGREDLHASPLLMLATVAASVLIAWGLWEWLEFDENIADAIKRFVDKRR